MTALNVSFAVVPISAFNSAAEPMPGTWISTRSSPWRMIVGSRVPTSSTRRRMISSDCCRVRLSVACFSASDSCTTMSAPSAVTSIVLCPTPVSVITPVPRAPTASSAAAMPSGRSIVTRRMPSGEGARRTAPTWSRRGRSASRTSGHIASIRDL